MAVPKLSTINHGIIQSNLIMAIGPQLRGSPCRMFASDVRVQLSDSRYFYPDSMVTCDEQDRGRKLSVRTPRVVFEVLSPTTESFDRSKKVNFYRAVLSIEEIVLIASEEQRVEILRRSTPFWYSIWYGPGEVIELASLGMTIPIGELYLNIEFPTEDET